jgi:pyruvate dehydrogenase E2 component (dihydrolipoamide acetyltransferase)
MSDVIEARVPDLGNDAGVPVIELLVKVGDVVQKDQGLLTLESDKATMEVPSPAAGEIIEIIAKLGDELKHGDLVAKIRVSATAETVGARHAVPLQSTPQSVPVAPSPSAEPAERVAVIHESPVQIAKSPTHTIESSDLVPGKAPYASPAVRVFARELGVDLSLVKGSERGGRIIKDDVQKFVKATLAGISTGSVIGNIATGSGLNLIPWPKVDFSKFGPITSEPLSRIKKLSGANLARNWAMIPHVTQFDEADITEMEIFRKKLSEEQNGIKITPLIFLIKASVAALKKFPNFNASLDGENLVLKNYFHIGIAVDTPDGLVVPVIRDCDQKGLLEISQELALISAKARDKKLTANDMQGGCFTISSLGGIGGTAFTPIINAPEVAILGVSKSQTKPVWNGSEFKPRLMLPLSLSYDHRVIDGADAARFTAYMAHVFADLRLLLV